MPFFILNPNGVYPVEFGTYDQAGAHCDPDEIIYIADSMESLEEILEAIGWEEDEEDALRDGNWND